jgi:4-diphosphocytidyl-2-C-methyl-D-erythritol kinase
MLFFPNCKINLGLKIIRRRTDGYHDLETVFYPIALTDALELIRLPTTSPTAFTSYGAPIPGDPADNLCLKAWHLLKKDHPDLPPVHIHLLKQIPIGAGLGGGSSDGAWTLRGLDQQFQLKLPAERLLDHAARLGSDCPFFIRNTPCLGTGRGDQLRPVQLDLSPFTLCLVDPGFHISTAKAFANCTPGENLIPLQTLIQRPIAEWRKTLVNDFEKPLFDLHPGLQTVKTTLYAAGALYASLTGSGSSFFGIFQKDQAPLVSPFPDSYNYRILPANPNLSTRTPI